MTIAHFYCAALSLLFGVCFTSFIPLTIRFLTLCVLVAATLLFLVRITDKEKVVPFYFWLALSLLFFALGGLRVEQSLYSLEQTVLYQEVDKEIVLEGLVKQEPTISARAKTLYIETADSTVLVRTDVHSSVAYGDVVQVSGTLSLPKDFQTDLGREFAYTKYLKARGVLFQVDYAEIQILESNQGNPVISQLLQFKEKFISVIREYLPEPASGLATGLVLGVKGALGEDLESAFRQSGIIHIVVLSGYNVMLVVIFVLFILKRFLGRKGQLYFGLLAILAFALLVGLSATVVRASLMAALLLIMSTVGRIYIILRGLLLVAVMMVLMNPLLLAYDIGFQLSFLATLGLILLAPWLESKLSNIPNLYDFKSFLIATIATQIAVLPLLLYQIGEVSLVAVVVNVIVLPVVPIVMLLILLLGVSGLWLPVLAPVISFCAYLLLTYIISVANWFSSLPYAALAVPAFPWWIMLSMYLVGFWCYFKYLKGGEGEVVETNSLAGWTIVEDETIAPSRNTKEVESKTDSTSDTPIFFR